MTFTFISSVVLPILLMLSDVPEVFSRRIAPKKIFNDEKPDGLSSIQVNQTRRTQFQEKSHHDDVTDLFSINGSQVDVDSTGHQPPSQRLSTVQRACSKQCCQPIACCAAETTSKERSTHWTKPECWKPLEELGMKMMPDFKAVVAHLAGRFQAKWNPGPIKKYKRAMEKAEDPEDGRGWCGITDVIRGELVFDKPNNLRDALDWFAKALKPGDEPDLDLGEGLYAFVVQGKNNFVNPKAGYRDGNYLLEIQSGEDKILAELQIQTTPMSQMKHSGVAEYVYVFWRRMAELAPDAEKYFLQEYHSIGQLRLSDDPKTSLMTDHEKETVGWYTFDEVSPGTPEKDRETIAETLEGLKLLERKFNEVSSNILAVSSFGSDQLERIRNQLQSSIQNIRDATPKAVEQATHLNRQIQLELKPHTTNIVAAELRKQSQRFLLTLQDNVKLLIADLHKIAKLAGTSRTGINEAIFDEFCAEATSISDCGGLRWSPSAASEHWSYWEKKIVLCGSHLGQQ